MADDAARLSQRGTPAWRSLARLARARPHGRGPAQRPAREAVSRQAGPAHGGAACVTLALIASRASLRLLEVGGRRAGSTGKKNRASAILSALDTVTMYAADARGRNVRCPMLRHTLEGEEENLKLDHPARRARSCTSAPGWPAPPRARPPGPRPSAPRRPVSRPSIPPSSASSPQRPRPRPVRQESQPPAPRSPVRAELPQHGPPTRPPRQPAALRSAIVAGGELERDRRRALGRRAVRGHARQTQDRPRRQRRATRGGRRAHRTRA
jgi:hypothetical protein